VFKTRNKPFKTSLPIIKMNACLKSKKVSIQLEELLSSYNEDKITFSDLKQSIEQIIEELNGIIPIKCYDCGDCLDFAYYEKLLQSIIENNGEKKDLAEKLQFWKKTKNTDKIIDKITIGRTQIPPKTSINTNIESTVYLDFNLFDRIDRGIPLPEIETSKELIYCYSPIHLEETHRMKDDDKIKIRIETIRDITKNNFILSVDDKLGFYCEDPMQSYKIALSNIELNKHLEENRIIKQNDKNIYWEKISGGKFNIKTGNSGEIFSEITELELNKLLFFSGYQKPISEFKIENCTFSEIQNVIHSLYNVLDNLGYKTDKNKKTIKSSLYDIDHLVYASCSDFFITYDKKLKLRAKQVYNFLKIKTKIIE
jgi:DNA-directed RNA polymerase subunit N (RpoN/RPB10)